MPRSGAPRSSRRAQVGIRAPLPDTPSLPIGADGVTLLEHTAAYATFPNLRQGGGATRGARNPHRRRPVDLEFRPRRVEAGAGAAAASRRRHGDDDEQRRGKGTGRRARAGRRRGRGQDRHDERLRDAWFMGYTGDFVCGIWLGNDDYTPTNHMTGGSLPAMTWHKVMAYAHQGVEIKPLRRPAGAAAARKDIVRSPTTAEKVGMPHRPAPAAAHQEGRRRPDQCRAPHG